jgi:hypothetical protein
MRTYQHPAFAIVDRYDILYGGHKSDAGVGSGRRCWFLDLYGFGFSTSLWNVSVIELRDSVGFLVAKTVFSTFDVYCAHGFAHTSSDLNHVKPGELRLELGCSTKKKLLNWWYRPCDVLIPHPSSPTAFLNKDLENLYNRGDLRLDLGCSAKKKLLDWW